jgi:hypothetical protein
MHFEINEFSPSCMTVTFTDYQAISLEVERIPCTVFPGLMVQLIITEPVGWVQLGDDGIVVDGENSETVCTWLYFCFSEIKRRWKL